MTRGFPGLPVILTWFLGRIRMAEVNPRKLERGIKYDHADPKVVEHW
jgi:hypothetical protein